MKRYIILIFTCLILLSACTSSRDQLFLDTVPSWVTEEIDNEIEGNSINYYRIQGNGFSIESATRNAVSVFYESLSPALDIENKEEFVSQLSQKYSYPPLEMEIVKKYIKQYEDKSYNISYLISANKLKIEESKVQKIEKDLQISSKLENYESESNLFYRENKDFDAIQVYINAYIYAKDNGFDDQAADYLDTITSLISSLNIRVYARNSANSLEIRVNREQTFLNPLVQNAKILVQYNTKDIDFNNYLRNEELYPKDNRFVFYLDNKNINLKGLLKFKINLEEEIDLLISKGYQEAAKQIEFAINERVFSYEAISDFSDKEILLTTIENDIRQVRKESVTTDFFVSKLEELGASVIVDDDIDIDNIDQFKSRADYLFIFRAETVEQDIGLKAHVLSHGSLVIYDLSSLALVYDSELIDSIAIKSTTEESEDEAFLKIAKKAYHSYF
jgi:hypothetical protein